MAAALAGVRVLTTTSTTAKRIVAVGVFIATSLM
jgi:hypothetical protein